MTLAALLELGIVGGALVFGTAGTIAALRARAAARADRLALRLARTREAAFVDVSRRLGEASRLSTDAVRDELARAARQLAPAIDAVLVYGEHEGALTCVFASGERVAHFAGSRIALDDAASVAARARLAGHRVTLVDAGVRPPHPCDKAAVAVP